jgi:hypothetical protein
MTPSASSEGDSFSLWQKMISPLCLLRKSGASKKEGASYFALFKPLQDTQSQIILFCGVVLALAAGAPLPIIGVIFARIIDNFPPSEDEVVNRISQLLAVGELHDLPKQIRNFTDEDSNYLLCRNMGLGILLGHRRCSNIQKLANSND